MLIVIAGCEVGFWVFVLAGLILRYPIGLRRAGAAVLACAPATDLVLLVATVIHLRSGAQPRTSDGLAAVYLGVSIAFGQRTLRWADERFAHRFAGGPPATRAPKSGAAHARHERTLWYRHLLAFVIGTVLLLLGAVLAGGATRAAPMLSWIPRWAIVLTIDFIWSFSYTLWPRKPKQRAETAQRAEIEPERHDFADRPRENRDDEVFK